MLCQLFYIPPLCTYMVYEHLLNLVALEEVFLQILHFNNAPVDIIISFSYPQNLLFQLLAKIFWQNILFCAISIIYHAGIMGILNLKGYFNA